MPVDPVGTENREPPVVTMEGLAVGVPRGWEVRIRKAPEVDREERRFPVIHASTEPLPNDRADYGGGVVETLGSRSVFVSLVEFGEEALGSNLFPVVVELPTVTSNMFHPFQLQRRIAGQAGSQTFF
jgi:hypothetical protein